MPCPFCSAQLAPLGDTRFARCPADRVIFNLAYKETNYEHDYFDKEYKSQYGKSYMADRQTILARNAMRYERLKPFISEATHPQILEIGSAAGYFLKIMNDENFTVRGWEISKTMAAYANGRGLKTTRQDFLKGARTHEKKKSALFDVVAMFYVLEHLDQQAEVWHHLKRMIRRGGFLVLALPSASGPTFRFNRSEWYETHPADHAIDYAPVSLTRVGKRFGFTLRHASSEGIHPQRFPLGRFEFMQRVYRRLLEKAPLSDTIFAILERTA